MLMLISVAQCFYAKSIVLHRLRPLFCTFTQTKHLYLHDAVGKLCFLEPALVSCSTQSKLYSTNPSLLMKWLDVNIVKISSTFESTAKPSLAKWISATGGFIIRAPERWREPSGTQGESQAAFPKADEMLLANELQNLMLPTCVNTRVHKNKGRWLDVCAKNDFLIPKQQDNSNILLCI